MAEPDAAPQKSGAGCIAGPKKRPHPLTPIMEMSITTLLRNYRTFSIELRIWEISV